MALQAVDAPSPTLASETLADLQRPNLLRRYPQFTISPAIFVALIAIWWLATDVLRVPAYVLPPPDQVLRSMIAGLSRAPWDKAGYWYHAGITVWEALLGFAIGSGLGAFLGLVFSHWPLLGKSWYPYIVGFQSLPKVALAPLMVVWFGFGLEGKVFITAIITFFPVLVNMMAGYQAVEPERIELARSCNASELHLLTKIVIPSCLPFLFAGLGVASVLSILGAVVGEFVGASAGLGMLLMQYNQAMEISPMFAVILLLAVIGFLMNYAVTLIERRYCFWAQRSNATARP
jgi:NitT/TauT family transport system permease protein